MDEVAADEAAAPVTMMFLGEKVSSAICISPQFLVLARAVDDLAGGDLLEVPPVDRLAVGSAACLSPSVVIQPFSQAISSGTDTGRSWECSTARTNSAASWRLSMVPVSSHA